MKNSPDHMPIEEFNKRIGSYAEEPDDLVWKNIDAALRPNKNWIWLPWWDGATSGITMLFLLATYLNILTDVKPKVVANKSVKPPIGLEQALAVEKETQQDKLNFPKKTGKQNKDTKGEFTLVIVDSVENGKIYRQPVGPGGRTTEIVNDSIHQQEGKISSNPGLDSVMIDSTTEEGHVTSMEPVGKSSKRLPLKKVALYAHAMPSLTFLRVIPAAMDGLVITEFLNPSILSEERFGVSFSAGIQGRVTRRLEYYGGVAFYSQRKSLRYQYQLPGQVDVEIEENGSYTVTPKQFIGQFNHNMTNVGAQGGLLFHLYGSKLSHKIGAGVTFFQGLAGGNTEDYKNSGSRYLSYQLFYRNEVVIGERFKFFVQPTFTQAIQVDEKLEAPFKLKPYSAGIGLGILYDLK